jgi:hypothetical protein
LYLFTDNSTVDSAISKGNSKSKWLFQIVDHFRKLQFKHGIQAVVMHVSGKRMIAQGTDGVSRGNLLEGVGSGTYMMSFIPLHLSTVERHPSMVQWLKGWIGEDVEF